MGGNGKISICTKCDAPAIKGCDGRGYFYAGDLKCPTHKGEHTDEPCEDGCHGTGWMPFKTRPCRNMYAKQLKAHLGPEIAAVQHVTTSPLYELDKRGEPAVDLTGKNVFIHGSRWRNLLPHLKWVLGCKGLTFYFRVITDERIKNVFVGAEDFRARPRDSRHHVPTFNSLSDLVGGDTNLLIVRLGYLGYKNVAAAGALKEVLLIRSNLRLPTWLVEDADNPWTHSCDADVSFYIDANFNKVHIDGRADPGVRDLHDVSGDIGFDEEDANADEPPQPYTFTVPETDEDDDVGDTALEDMMNDPALGDTGKKKKGRW